VALISSSNKRRDRLLQACLFAAAFFTFAYFHQGGGWNQNSRFAMVRAIVEEGVPWIDSFLIYQRVDDSSRLQRIPVHDGQFVTAGRINVLLWSDAQGHGVPVNGRILGSITAIDPTSGLLTLRASQNPPLDVPIRLTDSAEMPSGLSVSDLRTGNLVTVRCALDKSGNIVATKITLSNVVDFPDINFVDLAHVGASGDVAFYNGHFHPNKAPGTSFAAVPAYFVIYHFEHLCGINPDEWWTLTLNAWLTSVFSVGLISAFAVVFFYRVALALSDGQALAAAMTTLAFAFGTMFFPYATMLYEHNIITAALIAALYFLQRCRRKELASESEASVGRRQALDVYLAGLCAGYAAITNYIIAVIVIFLLLYVVLALPRKNAWLWFGIGLLGPLLAVCLYHTLCFGTPFTTNYSHQNPQFAEISGTAFGIFVAPRWDVLLAILFSPFRGLFFSAPVLLLGVAGLIILFRSVSRARPEGWLMVASVLFLLLFNMSFNGWTGGWTTVPRYLGPAVPFLALPIVFAARRFFKTTCLLALLSGAIMLLTTAVDPQSPLGNAVTVPGTPNWRYNPLAQYEAPLFLTSQAGVLANTAFAAVTGPVSANVMGYYEGWIGQVFGAPSVQAQWNSFNLGEFLWPESRWSLLPPLIVGAILCGFALRTARDIDARFLLARSSVEQ
jgi:hypothetical protein